MNKTVSLTENHLFRRLYHRGQSTVTPYVAVYARRNQLPHNRLGITATKKIGNAVERNRARRLIRESYRLLEPNLKTGYDIVVVARRRAVFAKMQQVRSSLDQSLADLDLKKA